MARITLRNATIDDVDAIVKIAVDVIAQEPQGPIPIPLHRPIPRGLLQMYYRSDLRVSSRMKVLTLNILVMVAEIEDGRAPSGRRIIAHTVWDLMAVGVKKAAALRKELEDDGAADPETFDCSQRRDADWDRIEY